MCGETWLYMKVLHKAIIASKFPTFYTEYNEVPNARSLLGIKFWNFVFHDRKCDNSFNKKIVKIIFKIYEILL